VDGVFIRALTKEVASLPAIVFFGLFVAAMSAQADQAAIDDAQAVLAAIVDDAQAKALACEALLPQTPESQSCYQRCTTTAQRMSTPSRMAMLNPEKQGSSCNDAYAAVDFDATDTSTPSPTTEERIAEMPPKGEYCSAEIAGLTCTNADFGNLASLCANARKCEVRCADGENVDYAEVSKNRPKRIALGRSLNACESGYDATRKLVGDKTLGQN